MVARYRNHRRIHQEGSRSIEQEEEGTWLVQSLTDMVVVAVHRILDILLQRIVVQAAAVELHMLDNLQRTMVGCHGGMETRKQCNYHMSLWMAGHHHRQKLDQGRNRTSTTKTTIG